MISGKRIDIGPVFFGFREKRSEFKVLEPVVCRDDPEVAYKETIAMLEGSQDATYSAFPATESERGPLVVRTLLMWGCLLASWLAC
jgi:hypothetical protein